MAHDITPEKAKAWLEKYAGCEGADLYQAVLADAAVPAGALAPADTPAREPIAVTVGRPKSYEGDPDDTWEEKRGEK